MTDMSRSIGHTNPTKISSKLEAGEQLDPDRIAVWRKQTTPQQQRGAEAIAGDRLKDPSLPRWRYAFVEIPSSRGAADEVLRA
jgi:hypothetical protein